MHPTANPWLNSMDLAWDGGVRESFSTRISGGMSINWHQKLVILVIIVGPQRILILCCGLKELNITYIDIK